MKRTHSRPRRVLSMEELAARARAKFNRLQAGGTDSTAYRYLLPSEIRAEVLARVRADRDRVAR